jgi:hypothetical protein
LRCLQTLMTPHDVKKMMREPNQHAGKKPYESPKITMVSLRPEEAVLGHCKIAGTGGPVTISCAALHCRSIGS